MSPRARRWAIAFAVPLGVVALGAAIASDPDSDSGYAVLALGLLGLLIVGGCAGLVAFVGLTMRVARHWDETRRLVR